MISSSLEKDSKEIIEEFHAINERFFDQIKFPYIEGDDEIPFIPVMLNDAYSEDEPEYTTEDLIWKNPNYDSTR
ncbi:hypothetical protein [Leptospira vanthielii]|uniref:Uncharacterized protein n=1 Tax=Leptospira vanthielii TaxID=293085 RepID=A0ABY2NRU9_9LEPT|nr:hypothetical protein [Leptospira vanthielii]TGM60306.1 hypothetical protein EHQ95_02815 [Leptospira vanthielii]